MVRRSHWFWITVLLVAGCGGPAAYDGGAAPATTQQGGRLQLWDVDGRPTELASVHESQRDVVRGLQQHLEGAAQASVQLGLDDEGKPTMLRIKASQPLDLSTLQPLTMLNTARLEGEGVTDATVAPLKGADKLHTAWLLKTEISDTGMQSFGGSVKDLQVYDTPITGAGLAHLEGLETLMIGKHTGLKGADLRQLESLARLRSVHVVEGTDEDLAAIANIASLESLVLIYTKVSDAGVQHLRNHPSLTRLYLAGTRVTDAGLPVIATLPKLTRLDLSTTAVTDGGIAHLKEMKMLEELSFNNTKVSDQALPHLEGLPKLRLVNAVDCAVTEPAAKKLEAALQDGLVFIRSDDRRGSPPAGGANPDDAS